jgi:peptide alpha-N-acetyltransferase
MAGKLPEELDLQYMQYTPASEEQYLPAIRQLISKDLSEPYSIYVYRYFLYQWADLCYMVLASLSKSFLVVIPQTNSSPRRPSPQATL